MHEKQAESGRLHLPTNHTNHTNPCSLLIRVIRVIRRQIPMRLFRRYAKRPCGLSWVSEASLRSILHTPKPRILQPRIRRGFHAGAGTVAAAVVIAAHEGAAARHSFRHAGLVGIVALTLA